MVKGYPQNSVTSVISVTIVTQEQHRGFGGHPRNAFVDIQTLCLQNTSAPKTKAIKININIDLHISQSESIIDSPKHLTHRCESTLDSFCPQKRKIPQIRPIALEWITSDSSKNLDSKKWISFDSLRKRIEEIIVLSRKSLLWNPKAQQEYPKTRQDMSNRIVQM